MAAILGVTALLLLSSVPGSLPRGSGSPAAGVRATADGPPAVVPHPAFLGAVASTLDLVANRTLPGAAVPPTQADPDQMLYDGANGMFYLRGYLGNALSVVNGTSRAVETTLSVGYAETPNPVLTMALDPSTDQLLLTNYNSGNVSIVNTTTESVVGAVEGVGAPDGIVFDPAVDEFFVTDVTSDNVTAINATTDRVVAEIPVGARPQSIVLDPTDGLLYVADVGSGAGPANLTAIEAASGATLATVPVGTRPIALAWLSGNDLVAAANLGSSNVTVDYAANATPAYSVSTGTGGPDALAYAPDANTLFVANLYANNVTIVDAASGDSFGVPVPAAPEVEGYDPTEATVLVLSQMVPTITALNDSTGSLVGAVDPVLVPSAVAVAPTGASGGLVAVADDGTSSVEPNITFLEGRHALSLSATPLAISPVAAALGANGSLEIADQQGNRTYGANATTGAIFARAPVGDYPSEIAYDPQSNESFVVDRFQEAVTVLSPDDATVATVPVDAAPSSIAFDPRTGDLYLPDELSGNVTVLNATNDSVLGSIPVRSGADLSAIAYDPSDGYLYVADASGDNVTVLDPSTDPSLLGTSVASIPVGGGTGSFAVDPANATLFVATSGSGKVYVVATASETVVRTIPWSGTSYLAYDPAADAVYAVGTYDPDVTAVNASSYAPYPGSVDLGVVTPTGLLYDPVTSDLYVPDEYAGAVEAISSRYVATFPVTFSETGLPAGAEWSVDLNGTTVVSSTASVVFERANGSYDFTVPLANGFRPGLPNGTVVVQGGPIARTISFSPPTAATYAVDFRESGLPLGTSWSVSLNGSTDTSETTLVAFTEPNGSYAYVVPAVSGYRATPASGVVPVQGGPAGVDVTFQPTLVPPFQASLAANVSDLRVGETVRLTTSTANGSGPYRYLYTGLPTGCASGNASTILCTPTGPGTFSPSVEVTEANGSSADASTLVTVAAAVPGPLGSTPPSGPPAILVDAFVGIVVVAAVAVAAIAVGRSRRAPPPPNAGGP